MKKRFNSVGICVLCFLMLFVFSNVSAEEINGDVVQDPYEVTFKSNYKENGAREKVTADFKGPTTITYGESITTTSSWSISLEIGAKNYIIDQIEARLGFAYSYATSSAASFNSTYVVSPGKTGAVYFTPYIHHVYLKLYDRTVNKTSWVTVKTPYKLSNGFTDGLYELIEK